MPSRAALLAWLVLAAGWAAAAAPAARRERAPKAASWEEVNVLAHGLLQLGHGLREHVERLGGQLRDLSGRLAAHNASLAGLERSAAEQTERLARAQSLFDGRLARLEARLADEEAAWPRLDGTDQAGAENGSAAEERDSLQVRPEGGWGRRRGRAGALHEGRGPPCLRAEALPPFFA